MSNGVAPLVRGVREAVIISKMIFKHRSVVVREGAMGKSGKECNRQGEG